MKQLLYIICACAVLILPSCDLFRLDNFDGPNASVSGKIYDAKTGDNMEIEANWQRSGWSSSLQAGALTVIEQGWDGESEQTWMVKFNGEYTNNRVFAGTYKVNSKLLPCYDFEEEITLKKGSNSFDFKVTPFCRIINPKFSYDPATKKLRATFSVELGDASKATTIQRAVFCANTNCFVGTNYNNCNNDKAAVKTNVAEGETVTLEIDTQLGSNREEFQYSRPHYLRIGVLTSGNGFNTRNLYNYSPVFVISKDFSTVEEFNWDSQ